MEEFEFNKEEAFGVNGYTLDYAKILINKDFMALTRLLASDLIRDGYIKVGDFIKNISDNDLKHLIDGMDEKENPHYEDLFIMSEMLATGEGCDSSKSVEGFAERMRQLMSLLLCESLSRKGLVKVNYDNMSFHDDMLDKIIVEKI